MSLYEKAVLRLGMCLIDIFIFYIKMTFVFRTEKLSIKRINEIQEELEYLDSSTSELTKNISITF